MPFVKGEKPPRGKKKSQLSVKKKAGDKNKKRAAARAEKAEQTELPAFAESERNYSAKTHFQ